MMKKTFIFFLASGMILFVGFQAWKFFYNKNEFLQRSSVTNSKKDLCFEGKENFLFAQKFAILFENLNTDHWQESGDWSGDSMHDATSFAPLVLYKAGKACRRPEFTKRADKTISYELSLIDKVIKGGDRQKNNYEPILGEPIMREGSRWENMYKALFGALGLFDGIKDYGGSFWQRLKMKFYLKVGVLGADVLFLFFDKTIDKLAKNITGVRVIGLDTISLTVVEGNFSMYEGTKNPIYAKLGLKILDKSLDKYWQGDYYSKYPWSWPEALSLSALWKAYAITNRADYLQKAEKLYQKLNESLWDDNLNIYKEFPYSEIHPYFAALSGNIFFAKALIDCYKFTGQKEKLALVEKLISGTLSTFFEDGYLKHDIEITDEGYECSFHYCSGCNFFALNVIYNFNKVRY